MVWREAHADAQALSDRIDIERLLAGALGMADCLLIVAAALIAYTLRHGFIEMPLEIASTTGLAVVLTVNGMYFSGAYSLKSMTQLRQQLSTAIRVWTCVSITLVLLGFITKTGGTFSRTWSVVWYFTAFALLVGVRLGAAAQIRRWRARGRLATTAAIVDLCGRGDVVARHLRRYPVEDVYVAGVFRPAKADGEIDGVSELIELSRLFRIDEVLVVASPDADTDIASVFRRLGAMHSNIRLCPSMPDFGISPLPTDGQWLELPAVTIHRKPLGGWNSVQKRAEDLIIGCLALAVLWPVMLLIALCIRLESPGPVLFRQNRQGFNNNVFSVLKFRTMTHREHAETDVPQATRNDPRVTTVGRFLRRTSLDELPQLLNVVRGEMSLVGPRPHAVAHNEIYGGLIDDYIRRHRVRPGITGWAQVNGLRGETDTLDKMEKRVRYDLAYIDRWSLLFDIKIMALTVSTAVFDQHAY